MSRIAFTLACTPTAQQRARHTCTGRAYKSGIQQANERTLEAMLFEQKPILPLNGPVRLEFVAAFPVPRSRSKKATEAMLEGKIGHTSKPDLDNLCKQLKDALTRMQFWHDDSQVVQIVCSKIYAEVGRWDVMLSEIGTSQGQNTEERNA